MVRVRFVLIAALTVVALGTALVGCRAGKPKGIVIGFIVKQPDEKWFQDEWKFARKCAKTNGFDLIEIAGGDGEKVLSAIDNLAANGAQGFVICTPDVKLGPSIMKRAHANNMKVYSVDDQFVGSDGKFMDVPYMGISARAIGQSVGKALAEEMKRRGWKPEEVGACAVTFDELNTSKERTDGATEALIAAGLPAGRVFRAPETKADEPHAIDAANVLLTQHPEIRKWLIYSINDEGVLGAVRATEGRGFGAESVIGIGIGGPSCFHELAKPKATGFHGTCMISALRHGYETTESLYKWIKDGKEPPRDIRTSGTIVTRADYERVAREMGITE